MNTARYALTVAVVLMSAGYANANVVLETALIGNPGNSGEWSGASYGGAGPNRICGAVDYVYAMGKYEITAGQYTEFLNAVAKNDTYGLYNSYMEMPSHPCNIQRTGSSGDYAYSVASDWSDRPVNFVSWADCARFANWMHNGQPSGEQGLSTTEDGSYFLNGAESSQELMLITRESDATWVIPSEDEWYKAAYHENDLDAPNGDYFDYPTATDVAPSNTLTTPDPGNNATFWDENVGFTIGEPYYRTEVGAYTNSQSPYGTFDQGGNVKEWTEELYDVFSRGVRGGSVGEAADFLRAANRLRSIWSTNDAKYDVGFRLALVPEPSTILLLACGAFACRRRR